MGLECVCACACVRLCSASVCVFVRFHTIASNIEQTTLQKCTTWTGIWITSVLTRCAAAESQGGVVTALNLTRLYRSSTGHAIHALGSVPACPASGVEAARAATLTCIRPAVGQKGIAQVCAASSRPVPERTSCWTHENGDWMIAVRREEIGEGVGVNGVGAGWFNDRQ